MDKGGYGTAAKLFEKIEKERLYADEDKYGMFFIVRDNFHDSLKYAILNERISPADAFIFISDEPQLTDDVLYAYAAGFVEWLALEYNIGVPKWAENKRAYKFKDYFLCSDCSIRRMLDSAKESPVSMRSRGFYQNKQDFDVC